MIFFQINYNKFDFIPILVYYLLSSTKMQRKIKINDDPWLESRFLKLFENFDKSEQIRIMECIFHIVDNFNWNPTPPNAKPLFDTWEEELNEFRISLNKILLRIHYFLTDKHVVILNAYIKPNGTKSRNEYNKALKKQLDKKIDMFIQEALELKKEYFINNDNYHEL